MRDQKEAIYDLKKDECEGGVIKDFNLTGDILIEVMQRGVTRDKKISRMNYNLAFLQKHEGRYTIGLSGYELSGKRKDYELMIELEEYCECQGNFEQVCFCNMVRKRQLFYWNRMYRIIEER